MDRPFDGENKDSEIDGLTTSGRGSEADFIRLFAQHHSDILAYIYRLVHDRDDADDLFQRTSLVLWSKFASFEPGSSFLAWANKIAYFQVCNFLRTSRRDRLRFSDAVLAKLAEVPPTTSEVRNRKLEALSECIEELERRDRDIVHQAYSGEHSMKELAARLGLASQTVYNRLGRIRNRLFACVSAKLTIVKG